MQLSQLSPIKQIALTEEIARAIAKVEGFEFGDVRIAQYAQINPRAARFWQQAEAAISTMKDFGIK